MLCNNTVDSSMNLIELDSYLHGDWTTHDAATHYEEEDPTVQAAFGNFIQSLREVDEERFVSFSIQLSKISRFQSFVKKSKKIREKKN